VVGRGCCGDLARRRGVEEEDMEREEAGGGGFLGFLIMVGWSQGAAIKVEQRQQEMASPVAVGVRVYGVRIRRRESCRSQGIKLLLRPMPMWPIIIHHQGPPPASLTRPLSHAHCTGL